MLLYVEGKRRPQRLEIVTILVRARIFWLMV